MKKEFSIWDDLQTKIGENKITINVWGREYTFDHSIFPVSVKIKGNEIIHSPIRLNADFEQGVGVWDKFAYFVYEQTDEKVVLLISATTQNIIVNTTTTIYFDGFIKNDFRIIPYWSKNSTADPYWGDFEDEAKTRLKGLWIDFAIKKEWGSLFHYWPNSESSITPSLSAMNNGKTETAKYPFKPYFWLGNEIGGFGVCCESQQNFELKEENDCINVIENNDNYYVRINILDDMPSEWNWRTDNWADTVKPLDYSFGFQATPVKKMPENIADFSKKFHIYKMKTQNGYFVQEHYDFLTEAKKAGVKYLILHADWSVFENHGRAEDGKKVKAYIDACHKENIKVLAYFGYEYTTLMPDWNTKANSYLNKNVNGNYLGGWQRNYEFMQRCFMVCYKGDYNKEMIKQVEYAMDNYGFDGVYTDGTHIPWECANEAHGCGYRTKDGKLHTTFPIYALREFSKELYEAVHKRGGIIDTHQSTCCLMATLAFADSYFDGENIQPSLKENGIEFLNLEAFRTEYMGRNLGLPTMFFAYTHEGFNISLITSISLLHNVFPGARRLDELDFMKRLWDIFDSYDLWHKDYVPYWENTDVLSNGNTKISYYNTGNEIIAIVPNYNKDTDKTEIILPKPPINAVDIFKNSSIEINDRKITVNLDYCDFTILKITYK